MTTTFTRSGEPRPPGARRRHRRRVPELVRRHGGARSCRRLCWRAACDRMTGPGLATFGPAVETGAPRRMVSAQVAYNGGRWWSWTN